MLEYSTAKFVVDIEAISYSGKGFMEKVIITGVTGFFGSALAKKLVEQGTTVLGLGRSANALAGMNLGSQFIPIVAECKDYNLIDDLLKQYDIDVFYHLAWEGGFTTAIRDYKLQMKNAVYAGDAISLAHRIKARKFVYANTYNQYEIINFLGSETFEPRYTCIYSTGKTAGGLICRTLAYNLGIDYCAGLIPMPYGENNKSKQLVNVVLDALNNKRPPKLVEGNNLYDLVYIDDIVDALIAIGRKGCNGKEYYVGHRKLKTFRQWIIEMRNIIAPEVELRFGEYTDNQQIDYSMVDLDLLYRDTGFECHADFAEKIKATAEWLKKNPI